MKVYRDSEGNSIFDKIGGAMKLSKIVEDFYKKVLADPDLSQFFAEVDMKTQHVKLTSILTVALGGPGKFTGKGLSKTHDKMVSEGLTIKHFYKFVSLLLVTLKEYGASEEMINEVEKTLGIMKSDVLGNERQG